MGTKKYELLVVNQFDRLHNIQTIAAKSPEKANKIVAETLITFIILAMYLEIPGLKQELIERCFHSMATEQLK